MGNKGSIPFHSTKINNMSKAMKMTPFLIKLIKEKQIKTNRKK